MPTKAQTLCYRPGCNGFVDNDVCSVCGPRKQRRRPDKRGSAHSRGYGNTWRKLRIMVLNEQPLCEDCLGRGIVEPATDVDHITPKVQGGRNIRSNLQALCHSCHSRKTVSQQHG